MNYTKTDMDKIFEDGVKVGKELKSNKMEDIKRKEEYLFKLARKVLKWGDIEYTEEELSSLVMSELLDVEE